MTEHDDDFHEEHEDLSKYEELFRSKLDPLENGARKLGLYIRDAGLTFAPDLGNMGLRPVIVANFHVGDAAWSDRVQNADQYSTEGEFRKMAVQMESDQFDDLKAEMERKLKEGKGIFEEGSDDNPEG